MIPLYVTGKPMSGFAVARILESNAPELESGSLVQGWFVIARPNNDGMGPTPVDPKIENPLR